VCIHISRHTSNPPWMKFRSTMFLQYEALQYSYLIRVCDLTDMTHARAQGCRFCVTGHPTVILCTTAHTHTRTRTRTPPAHKRPDPLDSLHSDTHIIWHMYAQAHASICNQSHLHKQTCTRARPYCMHARTHARMHACTHARTHTCAHARTHARTHTRTHARTPAR